VQYKTLAPLHDLRLGHQTSFALAEGTTLAPIPDWLRKDEFTLNDLSRLDRDELAACTHCLVCEYDVDEVAELLIRRNLPYQAERAPDKTVRGASVDQIYLVNVAFWLERFAYVGFNLVFHASESSQAVTITEPPRRHDRFLYHANDEIHRRSLTADDLRSVQKLYLALSKIPRFSAPWTAFRAITAALQMQRNEIRHLLLWIALEALFGGNGGEIKYRLSQRLAFFTANSRAGARDLFEKAKRGYDARSKMAHGAWGPKTRNSDDAAVELTGITEEFVRHAVIRLLQDDETINKFCGSEASRCAYLDHLPFAESIGAGPQ